MKIKLSTLALLMVLIVTGTAVPAAEYAELAALEKLIDSTRAMEATVFAPIAFGKAEQNLQKAQEMHRTGKKQSIIDKYITESREYAENAIKATELAKLTLADYLDIREKAKQAEASKNIPELWQAAEKQFTKGAAKIEDGNVKGGLKEAAKAQPLYDEAELEAIRVGILGKADALIEKAVADEAAKYALTTLDKARTARSKGNSILENDRYERISSIKRAALAEFEARHASNIAKSVRTLERNDQAWERLMLVYELQMQRVAEVLGIELLPFDAGPLVAADSLAAAIRSLKSSGRESNATFDSLSVRMKATLSKTGRITDEEDAIRLAQILDEQVDKLLAEKETLSIEMAAREEELAGLEKEHKEIAGELDKRLEKEEKIKTARSLLNPSECAVIRSPADDIVLRLFGLSFDVGSSDIKDEHVPLLEKVEKVLGMFSEAKLMIEGHTDNQGDLATNKRLSENRAYAVMQYLRQSMSISAGRIQSSGYGPDKPIASNKTTEGRAKNRRIDIIIMQ